ncbi:unnamed protein product [Microthlaspi erraticum]|uniref:Uncharacterized protein n=1 Tax=Microthlaspi erraticum TaxID=1685480 RepID=A0A6D2JZA5_9BRAS|nr:unnamed protein product [Microthlaspi erraticum]
MAMKTSHVPLFRLLLCLIFMIGLVGAKIPGDKMGPDISTPPSGSCGASSLEDNSPPQTLARRPPCKRSRLHYNPEDVAHTTLP